MQPSLRYLSLGAGRQSTALYLLAAAERRWGDEGPSVAIFADTQDEPASVYAHLDRLHAAFGHIVPIVRVTAGRLSDIGLKRFVSPPLYIAGRDQQASIARRQCTKEYKIAPIEREVRKMLGYAKGHRIKRGVHAESWLGISTDEASRMKDARTPWVRNRYPLAMELRWSSLDCERYNTKMGFSAAKSACVFCPYTNDERWREMKQQRPDEFAQAVQFDEAVRARQVGKFAGRLYVHRSLLPLATVDFTNAEDRGQINMFENECEGMCGV
jgi:hypothetical protein